ncbi:MAG TPA: type II secretion system protein M [Steroidobacteraceae bacterium]|jgi:general secretion pathway protein M|nr:type II secretion system protein M [Steroidobacteraceae bacterium]
MQKLKDWFYSLQPRERTLVLCGGAALVLFAIYFFALAPFYSAVNSRAERVAKKQGDIAWMRSVGGEILALGASATPANVPTNESLVVLIDRSARECGLGSSLTGQTPNGENGIRVRLEQAEFDKLVVCLGGLQQSHGVTIESANIDRTAKPGFVNASLVLTRPPGG